MYTIFINDTVIYLTDNAALKTEKNFLKYREVDFDDFLVNVKISTFDSVYLYDSEIDFLWRNFKSHFKIIEAAGGIVYNEKKEILWIFRNERWDLPKGKIEIEESREIAAKREVEEECGISEVDLIKYVKTTYHIYEYKKNHVLKVTYWYDMLAKDQQLTPQTEEGITKVVWLSDEDMKEPLENTYDNIKLLFELND